VQSAPIKIVVTLPTLTVTYDANNASEGNVPVDIGQYYPGSRCRVASRGQLSKTGSQFVGWKLAGSEDDSLYQEGDSLLFDTESLRLVAQWEQNALDEHTVTLAYRNGTPDSTRVITHGTLIQKPNQPTYAGHQFKGWSNDTTTLNAWDFSTTITQDTTLYAVWSLQPIIIVFDSANGSDTTHVNGYYDSLLTEPPQPHRPGYEFIGWSAQNGSTKLWYFENDRLPDTMTMTLTAQWRPAKTPFTISATADAGVVLNPAGLDLPVAEGGSKTFTITLKPGYVLNEVRIDGVLIDTAQGHITFTNVGKNYTLTVTSSKKKFSFKYSISADFGAVNGAITSQPSSGQIDSGTIVELTAPTDNGYSFVGWVKSATADTLDKGTVLRYMVTGPTDLRAVYAVKRYWVKFDTKGGEQPPDSQLVIHGQKASDPGVSKQPVKDGYDFLGWFKTAYDTNPFDFQGEAITDNRTLVARWAAIPYTITYKLNGNDANNASDNPASYTIKSGTIELNKPARPYFHFIGWYADSSFITPMNQIPTGSTGHLTLYARWGVKDVDENVYTTVTIGNQVWTVENLRTTRYNDGSGIPLVADSVEWSTLTEPGYCYYQNTTDTVLQKKWGALYNWYVVAPNNPQKLAPAGWHVPTDEDWTTLSTYLGGEMVAGGKMKEAGTANWTSPNTGATNSSGFSALPVGIRFYLGDFYGRSWFAYWWSATEYDLEPAYSRYLSCDEGKLRNSYDIKSDGFSVRLVRDLE
jgi:uncharacterized protein (TIGR02145 family)/uncharacterized repeat protein (TIGR02543 family)